MIQNDVIFNEDTKLIQIYLCAYNKIIYTFSVCKY